jgi:hypothetical protein
MPTGLAITPSPNFLFDRANILSYEESTAKATYY